MRLSGTIILSLVLGLFLVACQATTSDPAITAKVKTSLIQNQTVDGTDINVDTTNGVVTLTGTVKSEAAKNQAMTIARQTDGVKQVVDKLTVKPESDQTGTATGANREVVDPGTREDFEKNKESYGSQAKRLGRRVGQGADDLWIWTKTTSALTTADDLRNSTIDVDVDNNVVTLSGTVPNQAQKNRAAQLARGIEGVKNVVNNLRVS